MKLGINHFMSLDLGLLIGQMWALSISGSQGSQDLGTAISKHSLDA